MILYHILPKLSISVNLKFQKTKTDAPVVINLFFKNYIHLSVFHSYFHQSNKSYQHICTSIMMSYFMELVQRCLFLFACFCFCCSKDTAATTAAAELIIRPTRDASPAAKIRKEGFQNVFYVWTKSHILVTLRWGGGRSSGHENTCRWFLNRYK